MKEIGSIPLTWLDAGETERYEAQVIETPTLQIVPINFTDTEALTQAAAPRSELDYTNYNLSVNYRILPPSVPRGLVEQEPCIVNLQNAAKKVDDFKFLIVRHKFYTEVYGGEYKAPLDLVGSMSFTDQTENGDSEPTRVSGIVMASQLSNLPNVSDTSRKSLIQERFQTFLEMPDHDVNVVLIPPPKPEHAATSPTRNGLMDINGLITHPITGSAYQEVTGEDGFTSNLYFFAHGKPASERQKSNMDKGRNLMVNAVFNEEIERISLAWRQNIRYATHPTRLNPDQETLARKQMATMSRALTHRQTLSE